MTKAKFGRRLTMLMIMQLATGCGYIKSLFPDKERDYQFRTEIPELIVPEDLKAKTLSVPPRTTPEQMASAAVAAAEQAAERQAAPVGGQAEEFSGKPAAEEAQATIQNRSSGAIVPGNPAVSSLQIDQPVNHAWRLVARALSRQRVEIVERNIDKGYFYVKYDPHATKPEDGTIWDEITFLFGEDPSNEQEYRISLLEIAPQVTEVTVQGSEGKTLSDAVATSLLKLITDGINQELPADKQDKAADSVPGP